jgi:PAS domain S-box-containing protein
MTVFLAHAFSAPPIQSPLLAPLIVGFAALVAAVLAWSYLSRNRSSHEALASLQQTRSMLEGVVSDAADAILVIDPEDRIRLWNPCAEEMFGYAAGEAIGRPYGMLLPEGIGPDMDFVPERDSSQPSKDVRTQRRRRDGSLIEVSLTRSRIRLPEGRELGWVEILRDITSQRMLERELIRTEKMAAVGKIASKVVHEIRNPLGSINLNVDLLLDNLGTGDTPEVREAREILQTIKRETRRLAQITDEYLQFSRMPQPTGREEDLNAVMLELADFLRPELRRSGVRLVLNLDDGRPLVSCDNRLVRQVVLNLIRNALEVVPTNSGQVMVVTKSLRDGGEIEVDDNGQGIPPEVLPRIFEPFYTTKQDGTGLGLAVVHQIVEEHGGSVTCQSILGKGTTFRIRLPRGSALETR